MGRVLLNKSDTIVKCYKCGSIYISNKWVDGQVEPCPVCGSKYNDKDNVISKWRVFILRFFGRL